MSVLACVLLRHAIHPRWVGDLLCAYCDTCRCLWVPEPTPAARADLSDWAPGELVAAWGK